ncbi:MAG: hypothetical protein OQK24_00235 [Magnetovibrio sp.]|nr:hypothetical protein [Magnetovibrio sp.]
MRAFTPPLKFTLLIALTALFTVLSAVQMEYLNGPRYWRWPWRDLPYVPTYLTILWAGMPILAGVWLAKQRTWLAMALILLGAAALQWGGAHINGPSAAERTRAVVKSVEATSYLYSAQIVKPGWLADYPAVMKDGEHHARNKPPGPIWFYRTLLDLGVPDPTLIAGILVGGLALLSVLATFYLSKALGQGPEASVLAAALMATAPGFVLFFPEFDQALPAIGAWMLITWINALKQPPGPAAIKSAALFGGVLTLALLWSYALLTLGLVLGLITIIEGLRAEVWKTTLIQIGTALATVVIIHAALWGLFGYDPIATFFTALENQRDLLTQIHRPWPLTIPFDVLDLILGFGWIAAALVIIGLKSSSINHAPLMVLSILVIIITGLLPGETARVLLFTMPMLAVIAGTQLLNWPRLLQVGTLALALLGVAATVRTMVFIAV